jgi:hypothetical protein
MSVNIGTLYRKRTVRRLDGSVRDMIDEANGGVIIANGRVVNEQAVMEINAKEADRKNSATEATQVHIAPEVAEQRVVAPSKMQELEKKVAEQDTKLDAILELLKKK